MILHEIYFYCTMEKHLPLLAEKVSLSFQGVIVIFFQDIVIFFSNLIGKFQTFPLLLSVTWHLYKNVPPHSHCTNHILPLFAGPYHKFGHTFPSKTFLSWLPLYCSTQSAWRKERSESSEVHGYNVSTVNSKELVQRI